MRLLRFALLALALAPSLSTARAQTVLFSDNFELGLSNWSTSGLWHELTSNTTCAFYAYPFPSGARCAWFGSNVGCNFDTGTPSGTLTLIAPVALPANATSVTLAFQSNSEGEDNGVDVRAVRVSTDGVGFRELGQVSTSDWYEQRYDLSPYAGRSVYVRFLFSTQSPDHNNGRGWFVDDVRIETSAGVVGTGFCAGDGSAANCPCGNFGAAGRGCASSLNAQGAELLASGTAHTNNDTAVLTASGVSGSVATFFQGSQQAAGGQGAVFGDGLLCTGIAIVRLKSVSTVGGNAQFPRANDVDLHSAGFVTTSGVRTYQVMYRDVANYCTTSTFNTTNGWTLSWTP
jgi:hypothetical protein